ncbi:forkhead-associated domain-containing protein 1-like [Lingula anatina]|uniref:Forkhead-associated domain-containing protein 1-like n=1 Tax=Lingula anatina TaxID=7574 RepID=A0A1S3JH46_LINAN|nr:forkhead-associated domain-containing protein 1-like [Lingula anatina]|eukprot:XP_013409722.1 forkhead-associated domain-containing protein 1-like [Lingula anatina]
MTAELRDQLAKLEAEKNAEIAELKLSRSDAAEESNKEVTSYKEQIKQHSVTICAMEERVMKLTKKNKDYQTEVTALKQQIQELKSRPPPQPKVVRPKTPPKHTVVVEPGPDVAALEQILLAVRRENQELKSKLQEQQDVILALRRDLAGASARMSDMTGELSEAQKEKLEQSTVQVQQKQRELDEERQKLAKMSAIVDSQKKEIQDYSNELSKLKSQLNKLKTETSDKNSQVQELELALTREKDEQKKQLSLVEEEGRITSELTSYGAQCRGERHEQVIARQREALAELRQRIKSLEQVRPPVPTHDQALQQVALLKKELAELRANQALAEDKHIMASTSLDRQVSKARGIIHSVNAEADIEKSAHRETMDALDDSENSYLTLLRAIASSLEMEEVKGLRSMSHIPKDERRRLYDDREKSCEMLASRIKVLKERISRKDELLQTYERDLARLRQAEQLAEKKNAQVESLTNDVISKLDETQYLRESLNRTRDRLDQEKRLNSAIKQKKTYHMENEKPEPKWSKHRCPPDDIFGKKAAKERAHREKVKRKNYEMRALKGELTERDRELVQASRRIHDLETSLGLDSEEFVDVE